MKILKQMKTNIQQILELFFPFSKAHPKKKENFKLFLRKKLVYLKSKERSNIFSAFFLEKNFKEESVRIKFFNWLEVVCFC